MTARVQPNGAMRTVLRRLRSHELQPEQVDGGPHWTSACPVEGHLGPRVRWDQATDGTVTVHACTKGCDGATVLVGLDLDDKRIRPYSPNGHDPFTKPGRVHRQTPPGDGLEIYEKLKAALDDGYDDGRGRTGRYQCPACGARGDGARAPRRLGSEPAAPNPPRLRLPAVPSRGDPRTARHDPRRAMRPRRHRRPRQGRGRGSFAPGRGNRRRGVEPARHSFGAVPARCAT
jgi:hypothetical protein